MNKRSIYPSWVSPATIRRMRRNYEYLCRHIYKVEPYGPADDEVQGLRNWCSCLTGYWPDDDEQPSER